MARCSSNVSDETNSSGVDPWDLGSFLPKQGRAMEHAQKGNAAPQAQSELGPTRNGPSQWSSTRQKASTSKCDQCDAKRRGEPHSARRRGGNRIDDARRAPWSTEAFSVDAFWRMAAACKGLVSTDAGARVWTDGLGCLCYNITYVITAQMRLHTCRINIRHSAPPGCEAGAVHGLCGCGHICIARERAGSVPRAVPRMGLCLCGSVVRRCAGMD